MKLTAHRGIEEIGGNCVEISTSNTRILIDVGIPLSELMSDDGHLSLLNVVAVAIGEGEGGATLVESGSFT